MLNPVRPDRTKNESLAMDWARPYSSHYGKEHVDLSLVLPTYNERENLGELLARIDDALIDVCFEAIIVDDDSPDRTWAAAREFERHYPWLRVIRRRNVRGLGSAVICGFRHARGNVVAVMDADLQHDVDLLPELLRKTERADFAVATRRAAGGSDGKWSKARRFASYVAATLARCIAKAPFSDPMSGFFLMRRGIFQAIDNQNLRPRGYKVLVYLYSKAVQQFGRHALALSEIGYEFSNRVHGRSKLSLRVMVDYFLMLIGLRLSGKTLFQTRRPRWSHAAF
jgi:dolichol-phosphate mannosyltransferase